MFSFTFILRVDSFSACLPTYNASGTIIPVLSSEVPCLDKPVTDLYALSSSTTTLGDGVNKKQQRVSMSWRPCSGFMAIGHRGSEMNKLVSSKNCMKEIMANTITSFNTAGQRDVRFFEFDVQAPESQGPHMDSKSAKRKHEFEAKSALMSKVSNKRRTTQQCRVQLEKPSPSWLRNLVNFGSTKIMDGAMLCPYKSQILVMSGKGGTDFYIVDILTRKVRRGPDMIFPTSTHGACKYNVMNDRLYVAGCGSRPENEHCTVMTQCYDISSNTWRLISPLPFPLIVPSSFVHHGMFILGGVTSKFPVEPYYMCYSEETDSWTVYDCSAYLDIIKRVDEQEFKQITTLMGREFALPKREEDGSLSTTTRYTGEFTLWIIDGEYECYKWSNMGDVGKFLQNQGRPPYPPYQDSVVPREVMPFITLRDDHNRKEVHFRAVLNQVYSRDMKMPHYTNWYDLPLFFYSICGESNIGSSKLVRLSFVVTCY